MSKNIFGRLSWTRYFSVLTNVGLLYFDDPRGQPNAFFPMFGVRHVIVRPEEVDGCTTAFRFIYTD